MGLFRKRDETYNEQMLREAGLDRVVFNEPEAEPAFGTPTLPDGSRLDPKEWDTAVTLEVPGLAGDEVEFTTTPDGDVIVSEESGDGDLSPLADAVERHVKPPYRAVGVRQEADLWAVAARQIRVAEFAFPVGERLALSVNGIGSDRTAEFRVDGEVSDADIPRELDALGRIGGSSFFVEAVRIDGDLWEYRVTGL